MGNTLPLTAAPPAGTVLEFDRGSLLLWGIPAAATSPGGAPWQWDARVGALRCQALHYPQVVRHLMHAGLPFLDHARAYQTLPAVQPDGQEAYPHQRAALAAWSRTRRGVVELPTGAGKTRLALLAIAQAGRETLVLVPTLELVTQWGQEIERHLGLRPGLVGGGSFEWAPVTVCTYASALRHAERYGNRFGLAVFDECHHLPGAGYARCAQVLIAPYRLGLSATLERADQRHLLLEELVGPVVFRQSITALSGSVLAPYQVQVRYAELNAAERETYRQAREAYLGFARAQGIGLGGPHGWQRFLFAASHSAEGRAALRAHAQQKRLAFAPEAKFAVLAELLHAHRGERVLVFTHENRTAHGISRRYLLPLITHQTPVAERREILERFREGRWPTLVTSRVLNEGVDVPQAAVAIILSGSASVREHVQRLGRILRKDGSKQALLYEVLTRHTTEEGTSDRRRQHDAYR